jgi:hypothetical protein
MEPMTHAEITIGIAVAMIPFLAVAALLSFTGPLRQRALRALFKPSKRNRAV